MSSARCRALSLWILTAVSGGFLLHASVRAAPPDSERNGARLTKYIIGVADLDKMYAFYHALGLELDGAAILHKPAALPDMLLKLVDVPQGTKFRNAMLKIPGADFALEATEFSNLPLRPGRPQDAPSFRERAYELVLRIPAGKVMSYGQVARVLGAGYDARAIGNIMHATPDGPPALVAFGRYRE